jgi:prolyl 4-hydroxylase
MDFILQFNLKRGGQRVATMLMYLTDGVEGGETHFPQVSSHCVNS